MLRGLLIRQFEFNLFFLFLKKLTLNDFNLTFEKNNIYQKVVKIE